MHRAPGCFCTQQGGAIDVFRCPEVDCGRQWHQPSQVWSGRFVRVVCPYCGETLNAMEALTGTWTCFEYALDVESPNLEAYQEEVQTE